MTRSAMTFAIALAFAGVVAPVAFAQTRPATVPATTVSARATAAATVPVAAATATSPVASAPATVLAATVPATTANRPIDPGKIKDIRELIHLSGQADMQALATKSIIGYFKNQHPDVPETFWVKFEQGIDPGEFIDMMVPIYERHFTADEIKELIKFWQSPVGQKLGKEQSAMSMEGNRAGGIWAQRLAGKVASALLDAGFGAPQTQPATSRPATVTAPASAPAVPATTNRTPPLPHN